MIFSIWGLDKSCKTTLALTFPKPLIVQEIDIGGFERASRNLYRPADPTKGVAELNLPIKSWIEQGLVKKENYVIPFQFQMIDPVKSTIRPSTKIVGIKELYYQWLVPYMKHLEDPNIRTVVLDTGTLLYELCSQGYLQEKQEAQAPTEKLMTHLFPPVLYKEVNIRMRGTIYQAKAHGKHLVLTHHARDMYALMPSRDGTMSDQKTGKKERSGWGPLGDGADVMVQTWWDTTKKRPFCKIELAEVKELEGMTFEEPTYDKIAQAVKMVRGEA